MDTLSYPSGYGSFRRRLPSPLTALFDAVLRAASRLETDLSPSLSIERLRAYKWTTPAYIRWGGMASVALFSLYVIETPAFPYKLLIPLLYAVTILVPLTSQFFLPASPIFCWLLLFYSSRFVPRAVPESWRPHIWVSVLPTLERVWYGENISDILTRVTNPILDILAWLPYGIIHFGCPFVLAALLFVFGPPKSVKVFADAFGFMNLFGVMTQILFPCAPPWYELREGLTPAHYGMPGSPGGLARIDAIFGNKTYTSTFSSAPMVFGAFPSLHAGHATIEALFFSYFFPLWNGKIRYAYWTYVFWLYWSTMYLTHHYLIDVVAGGCLATMCFFMFFTDEMRTAVELAYPSANAKSSAVRLSAATTMSSADEPDATPKVGDEAA